MAILKEISYRGGLLKFQIPQSWIEEYGEHGTAAFYDGRPVSGTLELEVITFEGEGSVESIFADKANLTTYSNINNNTVYEYTSKYIQDGISWTCTTFACIHLTAAKDYLLALFNWTLPTDYAKDPESSKDLYFVHQIIANLKFGR